MTKKQSRSVFRSNTHYYCLKCVNEIMPFSSLKNVDPDIVPQGRTATTASSESKKILDLEFK